MVQSGLVPSLLAYLTRPDPEVGHSAHPTTLNTSQGMSTVLDIKSSHSHVGMLSVLEVFWIHIPQIFVPSFIDFGTLPCYSGFSGALHEEVSVLGF